MKVNIISIIIFLSALLLAKGFVTLPRVIDGRKAKAGEFPYIAALTVKDINTGKIIHYCGGSIISNQWGISAAHCTDYPVLPTLYVGAVELRKDGTYYKVERVVNHEHYEDTNTRTKNDISLLLTEKDIKFGPNVKPINLPQNDVVKTGITMQASGWGQTRTEKSPPHLWTGSAKSTDQAACVAMYKKNYGVEIFETNICASARTCFGDSGGPLALKNELIGITSIGPPADCLTDTDDAYTRVFKYKSWIKTNMDKYGRKKYIEEEEEEEEEEELTKLFN